MTQEDPYLYESLTVNRDMLEQGLDSNYGSRGGHRFHGLKELN